MWSFFYSSLNVSLMDPKLLTIFKCSEIVISFLLLVVIY